LGQQAGKDGQGFAADGLCRLWRMAWGQQLLVAQLGDHFGQVAVGLQAGDVLVGGGQLQLGHVHLDVTSPRACLAQGGLQALLPGQIQLARKGEAQDHAWRQLLQVRDQLVKI